MTKSTGNKTGASEAARVIERFVSTLEKVLIERSIVQKNNTKKGRSSAKRTTKKGAKL